MTSRIEHARHHTQLLGAVGLAIIVLVSSLLIATYQKAFKDVVHVKVHSDRNGLLLDEGARVRLAGVAVGEVRATDLRHDGQVEIDLAIDEDKADLVPADVVASIRGTTVFGSKFVDLQIPEASGATKAIAAGDVINADHVTIEVNDVFAKGQEVLTAVDPAALNSTLTSVSTALRGRGNKLGQFFTDWNEYFGRIEPHLDALDFVLETSPGVLHTWAAAAPALIRAADNFGSTSETLATHESELGDLLGAARTGARSAENFLVKVEAPLLAFNAQWLPVTRLGAEYSPEYTCVIKSLHRHRVLFDKIFGNEKAGEHYFYSNIGVLPGQAAYTFEDNAPKIVTGVGPACYPEATPENPTVPHVNFDDGTKDVYRGVDAGKPVSLSDDPLTLYDNMLSDWLGDGGRDALLQEVLP